MSNTNEGVSFPERGKPNKDKCYVPGCNSRADRDFHVRFHSFPKPNTNFAYKENLFGKLEKTDMQKVWLKVTNIKTVNSCTKVCSLHFKKEDYFFPDVHARKRCLRKHAFPSLHLPTTSENIKKLKMNEEQLNRKLERDKQQTVKIEKCEEMESSLVNSEETIAVDIEENELKKEKETTTREATATAPSFATRERLTLDDFLVNLLPVDTTSALKKEDSTSTKYFNDFTVQVTSGDLIVNFLDFVKSDSDLRTATGLESFKILDTITNIVKVASDYKFERSTVKMNTKTRVVMTYMKLKQNLSYKLLCVIFNCYSSIHCRRVFEETINMLSDYLRVAIAWPSKEEISKNFPQSFQGFENVRVILDSTEIFITFYTALKGFQKAKIMIGVSPLGNITYVSRVYGRKVSVTAMFEQSDLPQLLQPGDAIVVDEEFLIDAVCEQNQWKCIRPPILKGRKKFTKEESALAAKIAAARVPIKRANQRIKNFKVFETKTPNILVPVLEDIFVVVCATINMNAPIDNDENS